MAFISFHRTAVSLWNRGKKQRAFSFQTDSILSLLLNIFSYSLLFFSFYSFPCTSFFKKSLSYPSILLSLFFVSSPSFLHQIPLLSISLSISSSPVKKAKKEKKVTRKKMKNNKKKRLSVFPETSAGLEAQYLRWPRWQRQQPVTSYVLFLL